MTTWNLSGTHHHVLICNGDICLEHGGMDVAKAIRKEIAQNNADRHIHTTLTRCNGRCDDACNVIVYPDGIWYRNVTPKLGRRIVTEHLIKGNVDPGNVSITFSEETGFMLREGAKIGRPKPDRKL
ncbi:NAD(P)H-dependent oxidoreductase subunit E [Alicyclobacillus tolerans]|uniref:(2Fe-2S) ferredoxin n=1 Tax=Alicyclobacillus tolerans TaxID=90970 RepID=A0A1M6LU93_9BACL|nr:NAD(P)H-dependent oxidoreductase subunit E [Alicyclobacillus montanus]SHJ74685.1 (2Fe-2S) ferredoxin [Alicyclobacillus montanus]